MRIFVATLCSLLLLAAVPADAALPPVNGVYYSWDSGGTMLTGRFSESWPGGGPGQLTNTVHAQSWDMNQLMLGTQWRVWCPGIAAPPMIVNQNILPDGSGFITYYTAYTGGRFWLSQMGPWSADNLIDFTGSLDSFTTLATYHLGPGGALINIVVNVTTMGVVDKLDPSWSDACMEFSISNAAFLGDTNTMGPLPMGYPGFLNPMMCPSDIPDPMLLAGGWGTASNISLRLTGCAVPVEPVSWGSIKARHE